MKLWMDRLNKMAAFEVHAAADAAEPMLALPDPEPVTPRPAPPPNTTEIDSLKESMQLAHEAGMNTLVLTTKIKIDILRQTDVANARYAHIRDLLQREEIPVYPIGKVQAFMNDLLVKLNVSRGGSKYRWFWTYLEDYNDPVPNDVMRLIVRLKALDNTLEFVVTDYKAETPDPFLAIQVRDSESARRLVIAHWDEPGFHLTEKSDG